jgi:hypothetical protein
MHISQPHPTYNVTGMKLTLFTALLASCVATTQSFMLPRASILAFQGAARPALARAPAHAAGRRMMLSRSLAMAANPKVRC